MSKRKSLYNTDHTVWKYPCTIIEIVDGDTLDVNIDLGFNLQYGPFRIRLARIDSPELHTGHYTDETPEQQLQKSDAGEQAKSFLKLITDSQLLSLEPISKDSFGRWICELLIHSSDITNNVSDMMVQTGHAKFRTYS